MQAQINGLLVYSTHRQTICPEKYFVFIEIRGIQNNGKRSQNLWIFENKLSRYKTEETGKLGPGKIVMLSFHY